MTSQPEVPGAAAVYLFREETTEDNLHMFSIYVRLKVLTERGKEYANVELELRAQQRRWLHSHRRHSGQNHPSRWNHHPLHRQALRETRRKDSGRTSVMAKVFTLPDVEVGSIIEYRYKLRLDDHWFMAPTWYIQSDLYTRKSHYLWKPTDNSWSPVTNGGQLTNSISGPQSCPPARN